MADLSDPAATPGLPDVYTALQPLLLLLGVSNQALFSRPLDPLPLALAELTPYNQAAASRMQAIADSEGLYALWREDSELYATHLLLGQCTYASPLAASLLALLVPATEVEAEAATLAGRRAELLAYVTHTVAVQLEVVEDFLLSRYEEEDQAEAAQEWSAFRASIEAAFHDWQHSLGALVLAAPAPVLPPDEDETGWSIRPMQLQLDTLRMAATVLGALPTLSSHPFAEGLKRLPDFHPQRLEELLEYLSSAVADAPLPLSRAQGFLLYIAAHANMLAFVHDLLDEGGLDDLLLRRGPLNDEELTSAMMSKLRTGATIMLNAYVSLLREHEAEAADFQDLEQRLAPVLALASA